MRKTVIWCVVGLQVLLLAGMAAKREWIRHSGQAVYLRTAPVDPRDVFRGDYMQLDYDIAFPDEKLMAPVAAALAESCRTVYMTLRKTASGVAEPEALSFEEPAGGLFIKGRLGSRAWGGWRNHGRIKFGIEKYFIEQDSGQALEDKRGRGHEWQTPMEMAVALGTDGTPVVKGHRWSDVGIKIEVTEAPARRDSGADAGDGNSADRRRSPALKISLRNQSQHKLGLWVSPKDHCEFLLVRGAASRKAVGYEIITFANRDCCSSGGTSFTTLSLAPEQVYSVDIDLADEAWFVTDEGQAREIADLENIRWAGLRWIYRPPQKDRPAGSNGGPVNARIWSTSLRTARFTVSGRVD